jgi:hypothetical protein
MCTLAESSSRRRHEQRSERHYEAEVHKKVREDRGFLKSNGKKVEHMRTSLSLGSLGKRVNLLRKHEFCDMRVDRALECFRTRTSHFPCLLVKRSNDIFKTDAQGSITKRRRPSSLTIFHLDPDTMTPLDHGSSAWHIPARTWKTALISS